LLGGLAAIGVIERINYVLKLDLVVAVVKLLFLTRTLRLILILVPIVVLDLIGLSGLLFSFVLRRLLCLVDELLVLLGWFGLCSFHGRPI